MKKVLVIEDDADTALCISYLTNELGFEFIQSESILSAAEIIRNAPDLIILDYYLPGGPGEKLCLELKSNFLTKEIPVILMSTQPDLKNIAENCGADAYLEKPFDIDQLENMLIKLGVHPLLIIAHQFD